MKEAIIKLIKKFRRLIVFGFVGVANTLVDYLIFALCYELAALPVIISQFIGYMSGSVFGYFVNSNVTFKEGRGRTKAQWAQYLGIDIVLTALSGAFLEWVESRGLPIYLFKIITTVAVALIHYVIYKYFVFKIKKEEDTPNE